MSRMVNRIVGLYRIADTLAGVGNHASANTGNLHSRTVSTFPVNFWNLPHHHHSIPKYSRMATLEKLNFDNLVLRALPIDPNDSNEVRQVRGACFSKVTPTSLTNPHVVAYSPSAMSLLDLPVSECERAEFAEYFSGNRLLPGSDTAAHCYCGHQFGHFAGQLGDGAAM